MYLVCILSNSACKQTDRPTNTSIHIKELCRYSIVRSYYILSSCNRGIWKSNQHANVFRFVTLSATCSLCRLVARLPYTFPLSQTRLPSQINLFVIHHLLLQNTIVLYSPPLNQERTVWELNSYIPSIKSLQLYKPSPAF